VETTAARMTFAETKVGTAPLVVVPIGIGATKPATATALDSAAKDELRAMAAAIEADRRAVEEAQRKQQQEREEPARAELLEMQRTAGRPSTGKLFDVMTQLVGASIGLDRRRHR